MIHKYTTAGSKRSGGAIPVADLACLARSGHDWARALVLCSKRRWGYVPKRSVPVDSAGVAPQAILGRRSGLDIPDIGFNKHHAAADIQHDAADLAMASAQAAVHRRVRIAGTVVVAKAGIIWHVARFPHHEGVLPKLA